MEIINHRINSLKQLSELREEDGAEIDIRYHENELILHHDPFAHHLNENLSLDIFLENWVYKGILILNLKTEGIEEECLRLINKHNVKRWFFLDMSMPFFVKYSELAFKSDLEGLSFSNLAVRFSEKEPLEYALSFNNKAEWIWVDCFKTLVLNNKSYEKIKALNFKICLVSPELQNHPLEKIDEFKVLLKGMEIDAVCTKYPDRWEK